MKSHTTIGDITVYTLDFLFVIYTYTDSAGNKYSKIHRKQCRRVCFSPAVQLLSHEGQSAANLE